MPNKIVLASKSRVRKKILEENKIECVVEPSNVDEDIVKKSLLNEISLKRADELVLGADSVIDLKGKIISKPVNRKEALKILMDLNGQTHHLISSVCISQNGAMIWNYTDRASLTMKQMSEVELISYLDKISDEALYAYNVYQIEGEGRSLFSRIDGDEDTIMGLPVKKIKEYLDNYK